MNLVRVIPSGRTERLRFGGLPLPGLTATQVEAALGAGRMLVVDPTCVMGRLWPAVKGDHPKGWLWSLSITVGAVIMSVLLGLTLVPWWVPLVTTVPLAVAAAWSASLFRWLRREADRLEVDDRQSGVLRVWADSQTRMGEWVTEEYRSWETAVHTAELVDRYAAERTDLSVDALRSIHLRLAEAHRIRTADSELRHKLGEPARSEPPTAAKTLFTQAERLTKELVKQVRAEVTRDHTKLDVLEAGGQSGPVEWVPERGSVDGHDPVGEDLR